MSERLSERWALKPLLGLVLVAGCAPAALADSPAPSFTSMQQDLFATPGALATAWADFDGDGDLDLAVSFDSGEIRLYRNDKSVFTNMGPQLGLPANGPGEVRGLAWGDYDGDGDFDLYAARAGRGGGIGKAGAVIVSSSLFRNDDAQAFVDVAQTVGVAAPGPSGRHPTWVDYDNDGDLDLYVTQRFSSNRMYRNDGGRFVDVSGPTGLNDPRRTVGSCWFDFDQDGDLDVFVGNQQGDKDGFYRNDGGKFADIAPQLGMDQPHRTVDQGGVICALGDYDNDGDFDLFVTTYGANLVYRNEGHGVFSEVAASLGITGEKHTVGAEWADYDNDGTLDIYVTGYEGEGEKSQPKDYLFHNEGGRLVDVLSKDSPLQGADHGVSWADYDQDGDLDLILAQSWGKGSHHPLFRNELSQKQRQSSLQVQVLDRQGRATRAGAEVRLYDADGKLLGTRLVSTGHAYASQSVMPVHFGLARSAPVTVEVTFLTRAGRKTQTVQKVNPAKLLGKALIVKEAQDSAMDVVARAKANQPQHEGMLTVSGLRKPVEVVRDQWGIPHIYAQSTHDLFFAQGFVAAQDRMWNIELWRRNADGKLSEVLGPRYLERDRFARVMKYRGDWNAEFRKYHPEGPVIFAAFAEGVNAAIRVALAANKVPVEFELSGFRPEAVWTAQTLLSRMPVWSITRNAPSEVSRALAVKAMGLERAQEVMITDPPQRQVLPEGLDLADINENIMSISREANDFEFKFAAAAGETQTPASTFASRSNVALAAESGIGSNNWVLGGQKTSTGMPLLANDPHREVQNPALRYWVHLVAPGWNVIGATEPGMPGVTIGHNEHVGWGFTILNGDQQDLYVEQTHPDDPNQYLYKGKWLTMKVDAEEIAVKGAPSQRYEVRTTIHGPLVHEDRARHRAYAMRWTGYETGGQGYLGSLGLMQAKNWQEFADQVAAAWYGNHSLVYADTKGNYGYFSTGLTPVRRNWDGLFPVPGHEGRYEWEGYVPTGELPKSLNGSAGFYSSSNNNVFPVIFPNQKVPAFTYEYLTPYRNERVREVLSENRKFTLADMQRLQADVVSLPARRIVPLLKGVTSDKPEVSKAIETLLQWNFHIDTDSVAASIYEYWLLKLNPLTYAQKVPEAARASARYDMRKLVQWLENPDADFGSDPQARRNEVLLTALEQALDMLKKTAGADPSQWAWGNLHQARFIHPLENKQNAALVHIPAVPRGGDTFTVQFTGGASAKGADQSLGASVMFVFDLQDWDRSEGLNAPGNESQIGSPHYADLAARWGSNESFPLAFGKKKVKEVARERITLRP